MDFLDPKKKRAHRTRLFAGYGLTAIALAIATFILVFAAYGYDVDRHTGGIIQNGLIIVDAHPESADVLINQINRGNTITRLVLPADKYNVVLQRPGYRNWEHQVDLEGSSIEQLVYPFLFPSKLVSKNIQEYTSQPRMASESPDRHWLIVQSDPTSGNFNIIDLNNIKNTVAIINLPPDIFTQGEGVSSIEPIEWSNDNVHLLLKHTYGTSSEFIVLDRSNPAASVNINKLFPSQPFTAASLRDKKADQLYLFNAADGNLLTTDTTAKTVGLSLSHVISYKSYQSDVLAYVSNSSNNPNSVELHLLQNKDDHLIRTLPISPSYLIDMAQFNGHFYLTSGTQADGHIYVYKDPFSDLGRHPARTPQPFRVLIVPGAEYVSFSGIARFIAVQNGSSFAVYDIETSRQFRYDIKIPVAPNKKAAWMDGHRLSLVSQDKVNIFDFDGLNKQELSPSLVTFNSFFDRDYTAMFTVAPAANAPDKATLMRTELKVLPAGAKQ